MHFNFLEDVTVLDFTTRLPGPMSTYILQSMGAKIIKVENSEIGSDAFQNETYLKHAPHFLDWYKQINKNKTIHQINFTSQIEEVKSHISCAQIIICPEGNYFSELLKNLNTEGKVILKLAGGIGEWKSLHDLNALALTKSFKYHLQHSTAPPYLPFAGISFAQYIATASVAMLRKAENQEVQIEQTLYLKDITEFIFNSLHSEQVSSPNKFLHNGAFPCYQVYKSKDEQYLCLAAVEEKYWNNLQSAFDIHLDSEDRFDTSGKTTNTLKKLFAKLDSDEIRELIKETKTCLTIVIN